jgi:protein tyrosine phosphatase (PTP) superfamily phosphohydrolase (DUF442 family)
LSQSDLDVLNAFLDTHADEKVLVHCRKGGRAAALAVLHLASKEGWPAEEIPARGRELGLNLDPGLLRLISPFLQPTKD